MDIQFINITSYRGISSNAEHYYARVATDVKAVNRCFVESDSGCYPHLCDQDMIFYPNQEYAIELCKKDNQLFLNYHGVTETQISDMMTRGTIRFPSVLDIIKQARKTYPNSILCFYFQNNRKAFFSYLNSLIENDKATLEEICKLLEMKENEV
jgi:hypothetical protein